MKVFFLHRKHLMASVLCIALMLVVSLNFIMLRQTHALAAASIARQISTDPFTNSTSQHQTEVEPSTFSYGSTIVSVFQSGRFAKGGGASDILWATSFNSGQTWKVGVFPGITVYVGGSYARASNAVVVYDQAHHIWQASILVAKTFFENSSGSSAIVISRSTNGLNWSKPILVAASGPTDYFDKDWIVCDNYPTSPFYGRCYEQWDNANTGNQIMMSYSNNGGLTWSQAASPASQSFLAIGGQPVVQPNGHIVVPIYGYDKTTNADGIYSYRSINGGATWTDLEEISPSTYSGTADPFYRGGSLPSARVDVSGKVYLVWAGCYFEADCLANETGNTTDDIVMTTTTDGLTWTPLQRIPLDPIGSDVEHVTAGLAIDSNTQGSHAHLAVDYYYWANAGHCDASNCQAYVGIATSINGGATWSQRQILAGPTTPDWWAITESGYMTGDYITNAISNNRAVAVVPIATAPTGTILHQAMYAGSVPVIGGSNPCDQLTSSRVKPNTNLRTTSEHKSNKNYLGA
ncbi:MAG: exo-alpha-sialidase [Ktedonobacteraceae bacterium]|nr:exo-alpha-sialidase [Ktedonobacteraceae bacterium]